jgi:hypothetical protein
MSRKLVVAADFIARDGDGRAVGRIGIADVEGFLLPGERVVDALRLRRRGALDEVPVGQLEMHVLGEEGFGENTRRIGLERAPGLPPAAGG